jgi:hypothetical protein
VPTTPTGPKGHRPERNPLGSLTRKLERLELAHLREFIEEQRATIEALEADLADTKRRLLWAEEAADSWRDDALRAIEQAGATPGLMLDGTVVAVPAGVH